MVGCVTATALAETTLDLALREGRDRRASDALVMAGNPVDFRIDGENVPRREHVFSQATIDLFIERAFDGAPALRERLASQGDASIGYDVPGAGRLRVHVERIDGVHVLTLRFVDEQLEPLEEDHQLPKAIREIALLPDGLVVVCGRNGSGKTRLLNRIVNYRRRKLPGKRGLLLENPMEFRHRPEPRAGIVLQREYGRDFTSWPSAIEASLESNPDYVLVGQALGVDSMAATTTVANTGLPSFVTLHTSEPPRVFQRVLDQTDGPRLAEVRANLLESLAWVIGIRLVPTLVGIPGLRRTAAVEILRVTDDMRNYFRGASSTDSVVDLIESGKAVGMITFEQHLAQLCSAGVISRETAARFAPRPERLRLPPAPQGAPR
jgi:twitching motility protein PilT